MEAEREECFQFSEDTPNIIKVSAGSVTPNQTLTTFPTHFLSFAIHFTSAVWKFPFQANAGLFPERKRGRKIRGAFAFSTELPDIWVTIHMRRNKLWLHQVWLQNWIKEIEVMPNSMILTGWQQSLLINILLLSTGSKVPGLVCILYILQFKGLYYEFIPSAIHECEISWSGCWQAASHKNRAYMHSDREHNEEPVHTWDPSEGGFMILPSRSLQTTIYSGLAVLTTTAKKKTTYIFKVKCIASLIPKQLNVVADRLWSK